MGQIGSLAAQRGRDLGMKVIAYNRPSIKASQRAEKLCILLYQELDRFLREVDFLTIHAPLNEETKKLIDAEAIGKMKSSSFIINAGRGGIVNEADLLQALVSGHLAGAALDVFEQEPLPCKSPLVEYAQNHNNLLLTPHIGGMTQESQKAIALDIADKVLHCLQANQLTLTAISN